MRLIGLLLLLPGVAMAYERIVVVTAGITDYRHDFRDLPNARLDADNFAKLMESNRWLGQVEVHRVPEKDATITGLKKALRAAGKAACHGGGCTDQRRALVIFYFVGHGMTHGTEGFIVPREGQKGDPDTWLTVVELKALLGQELAPVPHVLFILGSCFSGTLLRSDSIRPDEELKRADPAVGTYITTMLGRTARVGIAAGTEGQSVPDGPQGQGSDFGRALINALTPAHGLPDMAADQNRDGCVNHLELASYLHNKGQSEHNHPTLGTMAYDNQGTVLLCRVKPPVEVKKATPIENPRGGVETGFDPNEASVATLAPPPARANPAGIDWVPISGGTFRMGSESGYGDEKPVHQVALSAFEMGRTEVTNAQWKACVAAGKCNQITYAKCWDDRAQAMTEDACPVVGVDWEQANAFAAWAGGRLPTEAQWEYAARSAGRDQNYPWGNEAATCARAVFDEGKGSGCGKGEFAWVVCSKRAGDTAQGLCDMAGNAFEWTSDWYGPYEAKNDSNPSGPAGGQHRVIRGGSWFSDARGVRAADRGRRRPSVRDHSQGFRLVRLP